MRIAMGGGQFLSMTCSFLNGQSIERQELQICYKEAKEIKHELLIR